MEEHTKTSMSGRLELDSPGAVRPFAVEPATAYHALKRDRQAEILGQFTPEQQQEIGYRQHILSSLAYFIGKDFKMPVELNEPGAGWHWDFQENKVRIDPQDLVEKPMDYLRFVVAHEGGHRRISRADFIPLDTWQQPGFSFMMNAIEDPRTNNFILEGYPKFRDQMELAYNMDIDFEDKAGQKAKDKLGFQPRFMQAGFEYIKQWFNEARGQEIALSGELPEDVRAVVQTTLNPARESWLHYPSKQEADEGEGPIRAYAKASYEINRDEVWPEFKKLIDKDMEDQQVQELMQDMQQPPGAEGMDLPFPPGLGEMLSKEQQKELMDALKGAQQKAEEAAARGEKGGAAVDLDSLSPGLKQKLNEYVESLVEEMRRELEQRAREALREFEKELNEQLEGKLSDNPEKKAERGESTSAETSKSAGERKVKEGVRQTSSDEEPQESEDAEGDVQESESVGKFRETVDELLRKDMGVYENNRREVLPVIDSLENDLRELFVQRRANKWQSGFKTGKRIDIKRRMQEKALGISAVESKAWQKREVPQEKDYAITLLVDLSGSMRGEKIAETFKAAIVLAEVLNRLSIQTEILGFNEKLYEYQAFGEDMSREVREEMGGMLREVSSDGARYNDDGWAVQQASDRLARQRAKEKFLFVLSDGVPEESPAHGRDRFELGSVVKKVTEETDQKLIGLGIGRGTEHVERYYPNSIANIGVREMSDRLADVIREAIVNYDSF